MKTATVMLRATGSYQRPVFETGLAALGYRISNSHLRDPSPDDLLVLWNRNRSYEATAQRYEARGARVIVAENGYLPDASEKTFALALGKHNGAGTWRAAFDPRFTIPVHPWRRDGRDILVLPQRGIGSPGVAMPSAWVASIKRRLAVSTKRPIRIRRHPGPHDRPLEPDLANVWACVTWGSGAAIKALVAGIPVFYEMPDWIGRFAAVRLGDDIEHPLMGDRSDLLNALSWAQWKGSEIRSGEAFRHLLG